eukprot:s353_g4.t1
MTPTSSSSTGPRKPADCKPDRPQTLDAMRRSRLKASTASSRISTLESVPEDLPTKCSGCGLDSGHQKPSLQALLQNRPSNTLLQNRPSNKTRARERLLAATYVANSTIFD